MTLGLDIGIGIIFIACLASAYRIIKGPSEPDRVIAGDLLLFGSIGLIALFGVRAESFATFDIVLIASFVGFLGALSLARILTRGKR